MNKVRISITITDMGHKRGTGDMAPDPSGLAAHMSGEQACEQNFATVTCCIVVAPQVHSVYIVTSVKLVPVHSRQGHAPGR